MLVR
ncbi:hypothetical protein F383_39193 [Gossypium arboreum]|jgi:hypothetical protein